MFVYIVEIICLYLLLLFFFYAVFFSAEKQWYVAKVFTEKEAESIFNKLNITRLTSFPDLPKFPELSVPNFGLDSHPFTISLQIKQDYLMFA